MATGIGIARRGCVSAYGADRERRGHVRCTPRIGACRVPRCPLVSAARVIGTQKAGSAADLSGVAHNGPLTPCFPAAGSAAVSLHVQFSECTSSQATNTVTR
jgi:hypothetical protein